MKDAGYQIARNYNIYYTGDDTVVVTSKTMNRILDMLRESDMTVSELSRVLDVSASTINYKIQMLLDENLIFALDKGDARKQYYHINCERFTAKNPDTKVQLNLDAVFDEILDIYFVRREDLSFLTCMYAWNTFRGRAIAANYEDWSKDYGKKLYMKFAKEITGKTIEETIEKTLTKFKDSSAFMSLKVTSFAPLSVNFKIKKHFPLFPTEEMAVIVAEFIRNIVENFVKRTATIEKMTFKNTDALNDVTVDYIA